MLLAHPRQVLVGLVSNDRTDTVWAANPDEVSRTNLCVVHRDDDPPSPVHGRHLYLSFVDVCDREPHFGEPGDPDEGDVEREALQRFDGQRAYQAAARYAVLAAEDAVADVGCGRK